MHCPPFGRSFLPTEPIHGGCLVPTSQLPPSLPTTGFSRLRAGPLRRITPLNLSRKCGACGRFSSAWSGGARVGRWGANRTWRKFSHPPHRPLRTPLRFSLCIFFFVIFFIPSSFSLSRKTVSFRFQPTYFSFFIFSYFFQFFFFCTYTSISGPLCFYTGSLSCLGYFPGG